MILAPGMQPATASRFRRNSHATSAVPGMGYDFSISTFMLGVGLFLLALVDAERPALLPDPVGGVRHVHVRHAEMRESIDDRVAEAGNAADVR